MIDRAASLQPARAPKQQIPLAPCKGRGRFPAHEEDRLCLPSGSVGSILGKATSTTDYRNTVNQTNKQTNLRPASKSAELLSVFERCLGGSRREIGFTELIDRQRSCMSRLCSEESLLAEETGEALSC